MKILKDIAQGVYDGLQNNEKTRNLYSYTDIIDVIEEFVAYFFLGLICTVSTIFIFLYFHIQIEMGGILILVWAFILYGFLNSKEYKKLKKK